MTEVRGRLRRLGRALAIASFVGYCLFFAASMLPEWIGLDTIPGHGPFESLAEGLVLSLQVVPCLVLAVLTLIPPLSELAIATGAFIVLSFGVLVAMVEIHLGIPSFVAGTLLVAALGIGRWPAGGRA